MGVSDNTIRDAITYDALGEAEKITGKDYKEDDSTSLLGLALHMESAIHTRRVLEESGDSHYSTPYPEFIRIVESEGFERVLTVPFHDIRNDCDDEFAVYWHPDGILLHAESYSAWNDGTVSVNWAGFYYCIRPKDPVKFDERGWWISGGFSSGVLSSGGWHEHEDGEYYWSGDHGTHEAFRFHLRQLRTQGEFITPWRKQTWGVSLLTRVESEELGYDFQLRKAMAEARICILPERVRKAIRP